MSRFTGWLDNVGGQVSQIVEDEVGVLTLAIFDDAEENEMHQWYLDGVKPYEAARRYLLNFVQEPGGRTWQEKYEAAGRR